MEMEKAEQQIKSLEWLPVTKMWNAFKVRGSLQLPHQTLSSTLLHWNHNWGRNFFSSADYLALLLHWEQNGSSPTLGEATEVIVPAPSLKE